MIAVVVGGVLVALGTTFAGWWAVPIAGLIVGAVFPKGPSATRGMAAGVLGWGALLGVGALRGPVVELASTLGAVLGGLPGIAVIALTLLLPALLAGAGAGIGSAVRALGTDGAE